jgi:hypothetical protein
MMGPRVLDPTTVSNLRSEDSVNHVQARRRHPRRCPRACVRPKYVYDPPLHSQLHGDLLGCRFLHFSVSSTLASPSPSPETNLHPSSTDYQCVCTSTAFQTAALGKQNSISVMDNVLILRQLVFKPIALPCSPTLRLLRLQSALPTPEVRSAIPP